MSFSPKHVVIILLSFPCIVVFGVFCLFLVVYLTVLFGFFFLTGAVGHHGDNLAEKILSTLPKLPGHRTDVMVNMVELTALQTPDEACSIIAPGCLAQPK